MNTTRQKFFIIALTLVITSFIASAFTKQTSSNKHLTIRTSELYSYAMITIVYEDGKIEEIDLKDRGGRRNFAYNTQKINETINSIINKGYELIFTNGGEYVSTYTFLKK